MTPGEVRSTILESGFDFARRQRDPRFRSYLTKIGWTSDQDVVVARDDEPIICVLSRIIVSEISSPCMIAIPCESEPFGFALMFMAPARRRSWWGRRSCRDKKIEIGPGASIGMLYAALQECGEYIPSAWARPMVFERATPD